jgi:hypothetical protein
LENDSRVFVVKENITRIDQLDHLFLLKDPRATVLMISDIRSTAQHDREEVIQGNVELQQSLYEQLRPRRAMLKFRLPYSVVGTTRYLDGDLKYGVYCPHASHETRLITKELRGPGDNIQYRLWDNQQYEKTLYFFETVIRTSVYESMWADAGVKEPSLHDYPALEANGLVNDKCYDCQAARHIAREFARAQRPSLQGADPYQGAGLLHEAMYLLNEWVNDLAGIVLRCRGGLENVVDNRADDA